MSDYEDQQCSVHGPVRKTLWGHKCDECENIAVAGFQKTQDALLDVTTRLLEAIKKSNAEKAAQES